MQVVGLQSNLVWEDPAANRAALLPRIEEAARMAPGGLVALPEMWPTGFTLDAVRCAEPPGGESERFTVETARRLGIALGGSIAQRRHDRAKARNVFVLALADGSVHRYEKIHPFAYGGECRAYEGGERLLTVDVAGVRVTPLVCYDLRFAELFTLTAARTDLYVVVANWPAPRSAHWRALLVSRAIETQAYVLGVNRVGAGGGLEYDGSSMLVSPLGEVLADAPPGEAAAITGEVDPAEVARVRRELPFLEDRRPDLYGRLGG
jgi:predicted amidohydrolase